MGTEAISENRLIEIHQNIQSQKPTTKDYLLMMATYGIWMSCSRIPGVENPQDNSLFRGLIYIDAALSSYHPLLASVLLAPFINYMNLCFALQEKMEGYLDQSRRLAVDRLTSYIKPLSRMNILYQSGIEIGCNGLRLKEGPTLELFHKAFGLQLASSLIQPISFFSQEVTTLKDRLVREQVEDDAMKLGNNDSLKRATIATANRLSSLFTNPDFDAIRAQITIRENAQYLTEVQSSTLKVE